MSTPVMGHFHLLLVPNRRSEMALFGRRATDVTIQNISSPSFFSNENRFAESLGARIDWIPPIRRVSWFWFFESHFRKLLLSAIN